jgi:hypothetical protein
MRPLIWNAIAEFAADHRRGDDLALALLEQQDGHALADVLARDVAHDARALGVDRQVHGRLLGLAVEAGLGVGQVVAGEDHLAEDDQRRAVAFEVALAAEGHRAAALGLQRLGAVVDHAHLQRGGAADDVLGLGGVLHAGQLHHHAVQPLLLDHRLGHAELVDPVVQRGDVLLERLVLDAARPRASGAAQAHVGAVAWLSVHSRSGSWSASRLRAWAARGGIAEAHTTCCRRG